jgi:hypothetical protein
VLGTWDLGGEWGLFECLYGGLWDWVNSGGGRLGA